ncbi:MAG: hypothetical protein AB7I59_07355 [Geminicoccaceae bacterium]
MRLESVRALKQEVAVELVGPAVASAFALGRAGVAAGTARTRTGPERAVALGIAAGARKGQYRLAVRIQRHELRPETDGELHDRLRRLCRGGLDVRYVGRLFKQAGPEAPWQQRRHRPLRIGTSVGHVAVTAGTLGSFALHRATGETVILSANHVLANENRAKTGQAILQPGRFDGGRRARDRVGALLAFVPLQRQANGVDAAVAAIAAGIEAEVRTIEGLGPIAGIAEEPLEPGDMVAKLGRTTGLTRGRVTAVELDEVVITYETGNLSFDHQIEIEGEAGAPFSRGGDSGALVVDSRLRAAALLFAGGDQGGSQGQGLTYASPIGPVYEALDLALAT